MNPTELFDKVEPLNAELVPFLEDFPPYGKALKHPLVFNVPYFEKMNAYINEQFRYKQKALLKAKSKGEYAKLVFLHERPYRMQALAACAHRLKTKKLAALFLETWQDSENIWQNENEITLLISKIGKKTLHAAMDAEDNKLFNSLPDHITVYRGCENRNKNGMSYTLSRGKAEWFANRYSGNGEVIEREIPKKNVLFYTNRRLEQEIVIWAVE